MIFNFWAIIFSQSQFQWAGGGIQSESSSADTKSAPSIRWSCFFQFASYVPLLSRQKAHLPKGQGLLMTSSWVTVTQFGQSGQDSYSQRLRCSVLHMEWNKRVHLAPQSTQLIESSKHVLKDSWNWCWKCSWVRLTTSISFLYQGGELARRSAVLNGDGYLTHFYDDARTMYEFFLRGVRVSSKSQTHECSVYLSPNV